MNSIKPQLPEPNADALAATRQLSELIRARIGERGGWMSFEEFMQAALYEPGLGYYSAGSRKFGPDGDFVTAPELGDFLARAIAVTVSASLYAMPRPVILELGAGTGRLAAQLLDLLPQFGVAEVDYRILEPSADLRDRQAANLARFSSQVEWLDELGDLRFQGLILANEVADALPTCRFVKRNGAAVALGVTVESETFRWAEGPADPRLATAVADLELQLSAPLPDGYHSELNRFVRPWVSSLANVLEDGALLMVDYGLVRREYYHPTRVDGTLICHYRHRAHTDAFLYPGLQDISAWVDFSACADAGVGAGLDVAGFANQGHFIVEALAAHAGVLADSSPAQLSAFKTLVLPGEMGEKFKLLLLTKHLDGLSLPGRDLRSRL